MSDLIRTLNVIKTRRDSSWLADSQQRALAELKEALRAPGTVNLCGPIGGGKTFLAWTLADELGYIYFSHLRYFEQADDVDAAGVILDNGWSKRRFHREALKMLRFRGVRHAVFVTRQLIQDYTHYVELRLTEADVTQVRDNLASVGIFHLATETPSLWHLINPYL